MQSWTVVDDFGGLSGLLACHAVGGNSDVLSRKIKLRPFVSHMWEGIVCRYPLALRSVHAVIWSLTGCAPGERFGAALVSSSWSSDPPKSDLPR